MTVDSTTPSPFAAALLFGYVANYLYDGDAPLAERRAQALSIDQAQLRELLGEAELRDLLDADAIADVEAELQQLDRRAASAQPSTASTICCCGSATCPSRRSPIASHVDADASRRASSTRARRAVHGRLAGTTRVVPVEYAARYRDALGVPLPPGLPESLLDPVPRRGAGSSRAGTPGRMRRSRRPSSPRATGSGASMAEALLKELASSGRLLEGDFRPGRHRPRMVRSRRAPDDPAALAREAAASGRAGRAAPCSAG